MYFDKAHCYNKKDLKSQKFAYDECHKEDNKLFAYLRNMLDISKSIPEFKIIFCKSSNTYSYSSKLRDLLPLLDIPDFIKDQKYHENYNAILEN